jgi:hypothetical protein
MVRFRGPIVAAICALAVSLVAATTDRPAGAASCEGLTALALPHGAVTTAQALSAGSFTTPDGRPIAGLPAFCRVAGGLTPSRDSDIRFEVWMPAAGWNGKLQGLGNGGFAGAIDFSALGATLARGYAVAATDTGHQAGATDAAWALGHPEKIVDFGYRAIHETAVTAKAIVTAFYGTGPRRAYFDSCSNGGRQALMEAQRYPEDYDGIVAGAPANDWTRLLTAAVWDVQAQADPAAWLSPAKVAAIEAATLVACDARDGVSDGVIDNPARCPFDPATLLCRGAETDACLTASQIGALKKLYSGPVTAGGTVLFPGHAVGGATGGGGWTTWVTGAVAGRTVGAAFGLSFFTNMVFENAAWDPRTFDAGRDAKIADDKLAATLNAASPDLGRFAQRGGKLLLYHGWSDPAIAPTNTIGYYNSVVAKMGPPAAERVARLFMVPGLQHCSGGPGPNEFGQSTRAQADPEHDINLAIERWVEQGTAPARIIATQYTGGAGGGNTAARTRPLCPYPQVARWKGTGSTDDAANFTCTIDSAARDR